MSLINDALKRASQTAPPPLPPIDIMQPVLYARSSRWPVLMLPVILVMVLALAGWFFMKSWQIAHQVANETQTSVSARETVSTSPSPSPGKSPTPPPGSVDPQSATSAQSDETSLPPGQASNAAPVTPEPPSFPNIKLQGVFYREQGATVLINSKSLKVGDTVGKARVVSISRNGAVIEWEGERRELTLP